MRNLSLALCFVISCGQIAAAEDFNKASGAAPAMPLYVVPGLPRPATCDACAYDADAPDHHAITRQEKIILLQQKQSELERLQKEIRQLQAETQEARQILVRVQMLEVSLTKLRRMGTDFTLCEPEKDGAQKVTKTTSAIEKLGFGAGTSVKTMENTEAILGFTDWLKQNNIAKVLAEPTIVMIEGRDASFQCGTEIPIPEKIGSKSGFSFQPIGTQLDIRSFDTGNNRVRLDMKIKITEEDYAHSRMVEGTQVPAINTRQCAAGVETSFGKSAIISGLIEKRKEAIKTDTDVREENNEIGLMVVVTPELVDPLEPHLPPAAARRPGVYGAPK